MEGPKFHCFLHYRYFHEDVQKRRNDLNGVKIKAFHDPNPPYKVLFELKPDGAFKGINGELLTMLMKTFNFTVELLPYPGGYGKKLANGTWNGFMKYLVANEVDVAACEMDHISDRTIEVNPGFSLKMIHYEALFWKSSNKGTGWSLLLDCFNIWTWISLVVCAVLSYLLLVSGIVLETGLPQDHWFLHGIMVLNALLGTSNEDLVQRSSGSSSLILITLSLAGAVIFTSYTGVLTSIIAIQEVNVPMTSLEELAKFSDFKLGTLGNTSSNQQINQKILANPSLLNIYNKFILPYEGTQGLKSEDWLELNKGPYVGLFASSSVFQQSFSKIDKCDILRVPFRQFRTTTAGWMYPKNSILQPMFDKFILQLNQNGVLKRLHEFYQPTEDLCIDEGYPHTGYDIIGILFVTLASGIMLGIFVVLIEKLFYYIHFRKIHETYC